MNSSSFLTRYPEFDRVDPDTIGAVLDEVSNELNPALYGTRFEAAQGALAAHRLWLSPAGSGLRGESDQTDTSDYLKAFKQMSQWSVVVSKPARGW